MNVKTDLSLAPLFAAIDAGDAEVISRAVLALYRRQTSDEQATQSTRVQNGRGFTAFDAKQGSYMGKWVESGKTLSGRFLAKAQNMLPRYHRQLAEELSFIMAEEAPKAEEPKPQGSRAVVVARNVQPLHPHDCDHCRFLGQVEQGSEVADLYICDEQGATIARYGEGGNYLCAPTEIIPEAGSIHALIRALDERDAPVARYRIERGFR